MVLGWNVRNRTHGSCVGEDYYPSQGAFTVFLSTFFNVRSIRSIKVEPLCNTPLISNMVYDFYSDTPLKLETHVFLFNQDK